MTDWRLSYNNYAPKEQARREALLTLGNGYIALRGAMEEANDDGTHYPGTYLAGGYNRLKTEISGREIENEDFVNWPNPLPLTFSINGGEPFHIDRVKMHEFENHLDIKSGLLVRKMEFADARGHLTSLVSTRLVSMHDAHVAGIKWHLVPLNWSGKITLHSGIDGSVINNNVARYNDFNNRHLTNITSGNPSENIIWLGAQTNQSEIKMALSVRTEIFVDEQKQILKPDFKSDNNRALAKFEFEVAQSQLVCIEKLITIYTSKDVAISEPGYQGLKSLRRLPRFDALVVEHQSVWEEIWNRCDTEIRLKKESDVQTILRLHTFHILQTASNHSVDIDLGVPSRGWHGEAYRGHIFWDELYIMPFLILHRPHVARHLLMYRYRRLGEARIAAQQKGYRGSMFPWQSGSDGREESQKVHLNPESGNWMTDNSSQQRHINIAIAYNVWHYYQATNDMEFFTYYGAELLLSVALFWSSIAHFNQERGRYEIHGVMGPDEYHTAYPDAKEPGLNNNAYTNFMTVWVLQRALDVLKMLNDRQAGQLMKKVGVVAKDIATWHDMTQKMFIPFHDDGIISQFEGYEKLQEFPWEKYREQHGETMRLDRILEKEGDSPNKYKASKQADVLMIFYLLTGSTIKSIFDKLGYHFNNSSDVEKNIRYYQKRNSHGSTLSKVVASWVYATLKRHKSWENLQQALKSDIKDVQGGTTPEGIHLGAMAGTVDLVQRCYTGMEINNGVLWIKPRLPKNIRHVNMSIRFRSHWFNLYINNHKIKIDFEKGWAPPVQIGVNGKVYTFENNSSRTFDI